MEIKLPPIPDKDYFNMGETTRITQVPSHTLRYWESHVGDLRPARRTSGHRRYSRANIETIFQIKDFIERRKMTIEGARRALSEQRHGSRPAEGGGEGTGAASLGAAGVPATTLKVLREVRKELDSIISDLK